MTYNMTDVNIKIGMLDLDISQFDVPKKLVVLSARVNNKYNEVNGEKVKTEEVTKISCTALDADKVKVLNEMGISTDDLKAINLEIIHSYPSQFPCGILPWGIPPCLEVALCT